MLTRRPHQPSRRAARRLLAVVAALIVLMSAPAVDAARRTTSPTTDLGSLGGPSGISVAYDINKHGQIVGEALLFDGALGHSSFYAVRWDRQRVIQRGPERAVPRAINDKGQIVGQTDESKPFLWSDGNMTELAALDGLYGAANAISNHGR